jgi:hypothetical protein
VTVEGRAEVNITERVETIQRDMEELKAMVTMLVRKEGMDPKALAEFKQTHELVLQIHKGGGAFKALIDTDGLGGKDGDPFIGLGPTPYDAIRSLAKSLEAKEVLK